MSKTIRVVKTLNEIGWVEMKNNCMAACSAVGGSWTELSSTLPLQSVRTQNTSLSATVRQAVFAKASSWLPFTSCFQHMSLTPVISWFTHNNPSKIKNTYIHRPQQNPFLSFPRALYFNIFFKLIPQFFHCKLYTVVKKNFKKSLDMNR